MHDQTSNSTNQQQLNSQQQQQAQDNFNLDKQLGKNFKFLKFPAHLTSDPKNQSFHPSFLYSVKYVPHVITYTKTIKDKTYTVSIQFTKDIDLKTYEHANIIMTTYFRDFFFQNIIKQCFSSYKRLGFNQIYSPERSTNLKEYDIEIWSGFRYEIRDIEYVPMLNIDIDYLLVRLETVLDVINEIKKIFESTYLFKTERGEDENYQKRLQDEIKKALIGKPVVTRYNNNIYRVQDIDFNQNPECYFVQQTMDSESKKKKLIKRTYTEYLEEKYYKTVTDKDQPLIKTFEGVCLVPEFCMITGLSEETYNSPSKFNLVKDVVNATKPDIMRRIVDIKKEFFDVVNRYIQQQQSLLLQQKENQSQQLQTIDGEVSEERIQVNEALLSGEIKISSIPHIMEGFRVEMGQLQMAKLPQGPRIEIPIKNVEELEKKIFQQHPIKMFEAPPLEEWYLFYEDQDESLALRFIQNMNDTLTAFNYHAKPFIQIKVPTLNSNNTLSQYEIWKQQIELHLSVRSIFTVLLIPGTKGVPNPLYLDLKRLLLKEIPVPSQFILSSTIEKSRAALFAVTNKLLVQICAKVGGEPWAIQELPYFYECTMIVGFYVSDNIISYVCSLNSKVTRYWSKYINIMTTSQQKQFKDTKDCNFHQERQQHLIQKLQSIFFESLLAFKLRMNCCPKQIFFYTNSHTHINSPIDSKTQAEKEIGVITQILNQMKLGTRISFIQVDSNIQSHVKFGQIEHPNKLIGLQHGMVIVERNNNSFANNIQNSIAVTNNATANNSNVGILSNSGQMKMPMNFYMSCFYNRDTNQTTVTKYTIVKDEICNQSHLENGYEQLFQLTHRLCFLYFNTLGTPTDMPAPLKYAQKQLKTLKELGDDGTILQVHEHFDKNIHGLHYL
uniref:Otiwi11 n=1 Tax=Oxytricha trifallax TaxID=94289 RepID=H2DH92_OXYTR|nr:Otiwi11 [Sterkiella histriomuscorum]